MATPIYVFGNPFAALDHTGQPCGCFPFDPDHNGGSRRWIGAAVDQEGSAARTKKEALKGTKAYAPLRVSAKGVTVVEAIAVRSRTVFVFDLTPQPIPAPASKHYKDGVREGSLFPADEASAKALGVAPKDYRDPLELLAQARDGAIQHWIAQHGEPPPVDEWPENLQPSAPAVEGGGPTAGGDEDAQRAGGAGDDTPQEAGAATKTPQDEPTAPPDAQTTAQRVTRPGPALVRLDAKDSVAAAPKESDQ